MITVVMPAYNAEQYIGAAIESILNQTFQDFELIIVDDGSTDQTRDIIQEYAGKDSRIRFLQSDHGGSSQARNIGIKKATRPWIAMMDADDISLPQRFEIQLAAAKEHPEIQAWGSAISHINRDGRILSTFTTGPTSLEEYHQYRAEGIPVRVFQQTLFASREAILKTELYDTRFIASQDLEFMDRLTDHTPLVCLPDVLLLYRLHSSSTSASKFFLQRKIAIYVYQRRLLKSRDNYDLTYDEFEEQYDNMAWWKSLERSRQNWQAYFYRRAGLSYGEHNYIQMAITLALAMILDPIMTIKRVWQQVFSSRGKMKDLQEQLS